MTPAHAVSSANSAVKRALDGVYTDRARRKRKYTTTFTPEDRAKVGKYAAQNGVAKAQKNFRKLNLSESTGDYYIIHNPQFFNCNFFNNVFKRQNRNYLAL